MVNPEPEPEETEPENIVPEDIHCTYEEPNCGNPCSEIKTAHFPKHYAFEVEDIEARKNYTFIFKGNIVEMWNTSIKTPHDCMNVFGPNEFPFDCETAEEYYIHMYQKSLRPGIIMFWAYVDPENHFEPILEEDLEKFKDHEFNLLLQTSK